jgi:hypothetical protein
VVLKRIRELADTLVILMTACSSIGNAVEAIEKFGLHAEPAK